MTGVSTRTLEILQMLQWPGVGPARVRDSIAHHVDGTSLLSFASERFHVMPPVRENAYAVARMIVERCEGLDVGVVSLFDEEYPPRLAMIEDRPPVLFFKGPIENLRAECVAVVGTRQASEAGTRIAHVISSWLVAHDCVVISGLAIGIDTSAHQGALAAHGRTVAVLAHGLDTVSPSRNRQLALDILEHSGTLVSEHAPGVPARPPEFVRRNRIQSGLSIGSIVVESAVEGGAIHQAHFTKKQGRCLMVALAATDSARLTLNEAGARLLIEKLGATPIRSTGDLTRELQNFRPRTEANAEPLRQTSLKW